MAFDSYIEMTTPPWYTQVSPGVTPGFLFSEKGNVGGNKWLSCGNVVSGNTGYPIFGKNKLVRLRVSNKSIVDSDTIIQVYDRTNINTRSVISGATVTIKNGEYQGVADLDINLRENVEMCAKIISGDTLKDPVLNVFLLPRN